MMLYSLSHLCFIAAFASLRIHKPDVARPLRAPGGVRTALLMQLPAVLICLTTLGINLRLSFDCAMRRTAQCDYVRLRAALFGAVLLAGVALQGLAWLVQRWAEGRTSAVPSASPLRSVELPQRRRDP